PQAFEYLFLELKRIDFTALNKGSTQPLLTQTDLKAQPILIPPATVLERFHTFAQGLYERIDASERESRTLAALRDALLPKLISGELRVRDAERFLRERGL
ncbi:MAG: restriction endonuclease subunit S, partial [Bryobacteraceae bacterium]|nr:restriction endonuclease subunit S [Bryobacteraceae bacterium]